MWKFHGFRQPDDPRIRVLAQSMDLDSLFFLGFRGLHALGRCGVPAAGCRHCRGARGAGAECRLQSWASKLPVGCKGSPKYPSMYTYVYEGRPKTPVFSFNHRRTGRSKSCQKLCARKERASAAQGTRKVTVLKGFMY